MVIFTPLDFPTLVPDDWDVFWDIWERKSGPLIKNLTNVDYSPVQVGSTGIWRGLDLWPSYCNPIHNPVWGAPHYDASSQLPNFYKTINAFSEKFKLYRVRLIQSNLNIPAHTDNGVDNWNIRAYMHYTSSKSQWYFTKPNDLERHYINMPDETMWFAYNDGLSWHGSDYDPDHKKILIQLYFVGDVSDVIQHSIEKYKDYTIEF